MRCRPHAQQPCRPCRRWRLWWWRPCIGGTVLKHPPTLPCCWQMMEGGQPVPVPSTEGSLTTPSVVAFGADGSVLVGAPAKRQAAVNPKNTFHSGALASRNKNEWGAKYAGRLNHLTRAAGWRVHAVRFAMCLADRDVLLACSQAADRQGLRGCAAGVWAAGLHCVSRRGRLCSSGLPQPGGWRRSVGGWPCCWAGCARAHAGCARAHA